MYEEVSAAAIKRVVARQVEDATRQKGFTKAEMARHTHTSRAALDRLGSQRFWGVIDQTSWKN